jgi:hypothetical protein
LRVASCCVYYYNIVAIDGTPKGYSNNGILYTSVNNACVKDVGRTNRKETFIRQNQ